MDVPIMEFFAALGAGVLVSLWSKYLLPLLPKCKCTCCKKNAADPSDDITSSASTAAVISAASTTHF